MIESVMVKPTGSFGALLLAFMLAFASFAEAQTSSGSGKSRIQRHSIGITPFGIQNFIESEGADGNTRSIDEYLGFSGIRYDFRFTGRHGLTLQYDFGAKNSTYLGNLPGAPRDIALNVGILSLAYKFQKAISFTRTASYPISYYINAGLARFAIFSDGLPGERERITTTGGYLAFGYHLKMSNRAGAALEYSWRSSLGGDSSQAGGGALSKDLLHTQRGLNLVFTIDLF